MVSYHRLNEPWKAQISWKSQKVKRSPHTGARVFSWVGKAFSPYRPTLTFFADSFVLYHFLLHSVYLTSLPFTNGVNRISDFDYEPNRVSVASETKHFCPFCAFSFKRFRVEGSGRAPGLLGYISGMMTEWRLEPCLSSVLRKEFFAFSR